MSLIRPWTDWISRSLRSPGLRLGLGIVLSVVVAVVFWRYSVADHEDFGSYFAASTALASGDRIYGAALAWAADGYWIGKQAPSPTNSPPYVYPPPLAMLMLPLTALPIQAAALVWYSVSFLAVLVTSFVLARLFLGRSLLTFMVVAVLMLFFQPVRRNLSLGQVDVVTLCFIALGFMAFVRRRPNLCGLALAGAITIKPFLGFALLYFLWKREYRACFVAVLAGGALVGGSFLVMGFETLREYLVASRYRTSPQFAVTMVNQSPNAMLLRAFTTMQGTPRVADLPGLVAPLHLLVALTSVAVLGVLVTRARDLPIQTLAAELGLVLVLMLFVSPLGEDIHYVYLAIAVTAGLVSLGRFADGDWAVRAVGVAWALVLIVFLYPMHRLLQYDGPFFVLCAVAAISALSVWLQTSRRVTAGAPSFPPAADTVTAR